MTEPLLELDALGLDVPGRSGPRQLLRGVTFSVAAGEIVSLVGESGSGKSVTARAVLGMLPRQARTSGSIRFAGRSVLDASNRELRAYRAREVAMIFQDPRAHVNPVRRIGDHLVEAAVAIAGERRSAARKRAADLLAAVQIQAPERLMDRFPHELSGGMLQRVMIAGALMGKPRLLLADEPTTALDVTTQAEVMAVLQDLRRDFGVALLLITHDLELAAATADRTAVMYAGRIVEDQASPALHERPLHPYALGLLGSRPQLDSVSPRLATIPGQPIAAYDAPPGCAFAPRCAFAVERCRAEEPPLRAYDAGRVACLRAEELRRGGAVTHG